MRSQKSRLIMAVAMITLIISTLFAIPLANKAHAATVNADGSKPKYFLFLQGVLSSTSSSSEWGIKDTLKQHWPEKDSSGHDLNIYKDFSYDGLGTTYGPERPEINYPNTNVASVNTFLRNCSDVQTPDGQGRDIYLIGHSLGGFIAAYYAALNTPFASLCPGQQPTIKGVITIDSPVKGVDVNASCYNAVWQKIVTQIGTSILPGMSALLPTSQEVSLVKNSSVWGNGSGHLPILNIENSDDCFIPPANATIDTPQGTPYVTSYGGTNVGDVLAPHKMAFWDQYYISGPRIVSFIQNIDGTGDSSTPTPTPTATSGSGGSGGTTGGGTTAPTDGIQICSGANGGQPCANFTYTGDNSTVQSLGMLAHNQDSLKFFGSYVNAYDVVLCLQATCPSSDREVFHDDPDFSTSITQNQYVAIRIVKLPPPQQNCDPGQWQVGLYESDGYKGTCHIFGLGQVNDLSSYGLSANITSIKIGTGTILFVSSETNRQGTPGQFTTNQQDLTGNYWNDRIKSISVEQIKDTACTVDQTTADGVVLIRNGGFDLSGGCKLITSDQNDLFPLTWKGFSGLKFLGSYKGHKKVDLYKDANYGSYCGTYFVDQTWLLGNCNDNQVDSVKISDYTPPAQATNVAKTATLDHANAQAVTDGDLTTSWSGGNRSPLGFVWNSPQTIQSLSVFDRVPPGAGNASMNNYDVLFSDGTIIVHADMSSLGTHCTKLTLSSPKTVRWVNVIPTDASSNAGFSEVQIFANNGSDWDQNNNCPNQFTLTPTTNTTDDPVPIGQETPANCTPGVNQVSFFTGRNYSGQCVTLPIGNYTDSPSIGLANDSISSVKLGSGARVGLFENEAYGGNAQWLNASDPDLTDVGFDNTTSSVQVGKTCVPGAFQVALFSGKNYTGQCSVVSMGSYPTASSGGMPNDALQSLQVGPDASIKVFWDENFSGSSQTFIATTPDLSTTGAANVMSSVQVNANGITLNTASSWTKCSGEWGTCSITGTQRVRFGIPGHWLYQVATGNLGCTTSVFGSDPAPGIGKECDVDANWQVCSSEWGTCSVPNGPLTVRFGANGAYLYKTVTGSIGCNTSAGAFGSDPTPGIGKECDYNTGWQYGTDEFGPSFTVTGLHLARFGTNDTYIYKIISGISDCTSTTFGGDPVPGIHKYCDYLPVALPSYTAQYYTNANLSGTPTVTRYDPVVNFVWTGTQDPGGSPDPAIPPTNWSARWTKVDTFTGGTYTFSVTADDGVRLYIDGNLVIDQWHGEPPTTYTTTQSLSAGTHTIVMEYYQANYGAWAQLSYQHA